MVIYSSTNDEKMFIFRSSTPSTNNRARRDTRHLLNLKEKNGNMHFESNESAGNISFEAIAKYINNTDNSTMTNITGK